MNTVTWTRKDVKSRGMALFKLNYWKCVLVSLIMAVIAGGASFNYSTNSVDMERFTGTGSFSYDSIPTGVWGVIAGVGILAVVAGIALAIFVFNPLHQGCTKFYVANHETPADLGNLGFGFSHSYMNVVKVLFFKDLYLFLWTLLLVVPGIIKSYEYRMIPYLLAENPEMTSDEAFAKSKEIMTGQKWNAFVFDLSFIGWEILSGLTLGILGIFYVNPYVNSSQAELYFTLTNRNDAPIDETPVQTEQYVSTEEE